MEINITLKMKRNVPERELNVKKSSRRTKNTESKTASIVRENTRKRPKRESMSAKNVNECSD
jgi:hypothetical protein